jgi:hypothetical protein
MDGVALGRKRLGYSLHFQRLDTNAVDIKASHLNFTTLKYWFEHEYLFTFCDVNLAMRDVEIHCSVYECCTQPFSLLFNKAPKAGSVVSMTCYI